MRHTSFRRRSGMRITGDMSRMAGTRAVADDKVELLEPGDPEGITCACGVTVRVLKNGRAAAHAAGGYKTSVRKGLYKCEGSGVT